MDSVSEPARNGCVEVFAVAGLVGHAGIDAICRYALSADAGGAITVGEGVVSHFQPIDFR
ncbi:hypothetical protein [Nocardiopsis ansamitocini]|uniref:hypothetical protein n=1 Tax=Nocardiopsis ansamitocini TaxID=1670832 RepID=UPI0025558A4A|nr:hypothetical protein [Nocardiopsis ansamitocini]